MTNRSLFKILLRGEFIFPFLLFVCLWLYIFLSTKIFQEGFNYFLDDYQIFISHSDKLDLNNIFIEPFTSLLPSNETKTRLKPLDDVLRRLFSEIYGLNPFLWYLSSFIIAVATTTNFYIFARLQSFPVLESICFSMLMVFGDQAWTYARFGTAETTATFFTSLAFIFASLSSNKNSKKNIILDCLFFIFAILTALNKEAFLLMLPALAFLKVWVFSQKYEISLYKSFLANKYIVSLILTIFLLIVAYIKLGGFVGMGYAGIDENTFAISNISRLFKTLINKTSFGLAIILNVIYFILCFLRLKNNQGNRLNFGFYILSSLMIIPQLILYSKSDMVDHYLLPCVIGVSFFTIYPLVEIQKQFSKYFVILNLFVLVIIYNNIVSTHGYFKYTSNDLNNLKGMVQDISSCLKPNTQLIIFANPYIHYERLYGFKTAIIDKVLELKKDDVVLATYGHSNSNLKSDVFKEDEKAWSFLKPGDLEISYNHRTIKTVDPSQLKNTQVVVILGFHKFENDFRKLTSDWLDIHQFNYKYHSELDIGIYCKK